MKVERAARVEIFERKKTYIIILVWVLPVCGQVQQSHINWSVVPDGERSCMLSELNNV